jgi:hypothetical protein
MTKFFNSTKDLFKYINEQIEDTMKDEVLETVRDVEQEKIQEVVYDAYRPTEDRWERRYSNGGLMDRDNIRIEEFDKTNDGYSMFIKNMTGGNPTANPVQDFTDAPNYLAGIIEYGRPDKKGYYTWGSNHDFMKPRPFTYETIRELERTLLHVHAMKRGLRRRGIQTE